jgi:hypothetical protein
MAKIVPIDGWEAPGQRTERGRKPRQPKRDRGPALDKAHLALIRKLPCLVSGSLVNVEAAHVRYSNAHYGTNNTGGRKPSDRWTVPLSAQMHRDAPWAQHSHGEEGWWLDRGIDPLRVADQLYALSSTLRSAGELDEKCIRLMTIVVNNARRNAANLGDS